MNVSEEGAQRAAVAALWVNGGCEVLLRMPGQAASRSKAEELGLATPQFADVPVGPAAWRNAGSCKVLLIAAPAVTSLMGAQGFDSARSLFESAVGVVADGISYVITGSEPLAVAGVPCAYRVTVQEPLWS